MIKHLRIWGVLKIVFIENKRKSSLEASDHDMIFSMKLSAGRERGAGAVDEIKITTEARKHSEIRKLNKPFPYCF